MLLPMSSSPPEVRQIALLYDNSNVRVGVLPFVVASLRGLQATVLLGPQVLSAAHDEFIGKLFFHLGSQGLRKPGFRVFAHDSLRCLALLLPTELKEGDRGALMVSIGLLCGQDLVEQHQSHLVHVLMKLVSAIDTLFSVSILKNGAGELLSQLRDPVRQEEVRLKLGMIKDLMLPLSELLSELLSRQAVRKSFRWVRPTQVTAGVPRTILCQGDSASIDVALAIFLREAGPVLSESANGYTGVQDTSDSKDLRDKQEPGLVLVVPLAKVDFKGASARLGSHEGQNYICID